MFLPVSPIITIAYLALCALAGMAIGGISGFLTSLFIKTGSQRVLRDALIGSIGFLAGLIGSVYFPWHQNTISYQMKGGTQVTSTTNFYQHPERVAVVIAILLPLSYELNRFRRIRRKSLIKRGGY
jgi:NADH:ubiquinone oxidoreductase subunit 4 (subunit M)